MSSKAQQITIKEVGLTEVYRPPEPLVDVVFVHGLNGHPYNTWATHKPEFFWPKDLLPLDVDQEQCRILTYGYDANVSVFMGGASKDHVHHHAETLAARLAANRGRARALERPIIFVVHSLGGLVVKRMLIYCSDAIHPNQERLKSTFVSTYGILFLGTPHNGSDLAKWGSMLQSISAAAIPKKLLDSQSQLVKALETNNDTLQVINREFTQISPNFKIYFFHEAKPMDLKGTRQFVVDEDSAAPNLQGVERAGIEKDHSTMCKFTDEDSAGYDLVSEGIQRYSSEAPAKIAARWQAERRNQQLTKQDIVRDLLGDDIPDALATSTKAPSDHVSRGTSMDNSIISDKALELGSSKSSNGPLLVAPLGFRPNSIFKGFELELEWMNRKLKNEQQAEIGTTAILLWGPPGCGKTHLARQYVYIHRHEHLAGTFWLDCTSMDSMIKDYWEIGRRLGCFNHIQSTISTSDSTFIRIVRETLQERQGWIFVFDGVSFTTEDEITDFQQYLPDSRGNKIIYTSVDKTLARRNRLLVPVALRVPPLAKGAACELLFESLNINSRKATPTQRRKARELVHYFRGLPLGIHAAAHVLIARGRPLERYVLGSLTDDRLTQPFLDIIEKLTEDDSREALRLLIILSFIYHRVPVALIQFGAKFLAEQTFDVESAGSIDTEKRHLDNTIAILIQRGLVERQLQPLSASSSDWDETSPEASRRSTYDSNPYSDQALPVIPTIPQDSSGRDLMIVASSQTDTDSIGSVPIGIDTIRIHTVVQAVILDEKRKQKADYWKWLVLTCNFLEASFRKAKSRVMQTGGQAFITDLYEYKTHGRSLLNHFPNPSASPVTRSLFDARHKLRDLLREIDCEIEDQTPSQTSGETGNRVQRSVFERFASSSEDGPDTPTHDLTRITTWDPALIENKTESPTKIYGHDSSPTRFSSDFDDGYLPDDDDDSVHTPKRVSVGSKPKTSIAKIPDKLSSLSIRETILKGLPAGKKKDLGEFKKVPLVGHVENENAKPVPPLPSSKPSWWPNPFRRSSSTSRAERALAALRARSSSPLKRPASNQQSDIPVMLPVDDPNPTAVGPSNEDTSMNTQISAADDNLPMSIPFIRKPESERRNHNRNMSTSPRLLPALLTSQAEISWDGLPIEENITITRRRPPGVRAIPISVGENFISVASIPEGYYSSTVMSRGPSTESHLSVQSLPTAPGSLASSPMPNTSEHFGLKRPGLQSIGSALEPVRTIRQSDWALTSPYKMDDELGRIMDNSDLAP